MIFVTVGTTQFDELVEAIDKIAPKLDEEIVVQTGDGKYIPRNCKHFAFDDDLLKYFEKANTVIAHGGAGITFEVLHLGKTLISIANQHALEGHQEDLLEKLSQDGYLIWCNDLDRIENCIKEAKKMGIRRYVRPECGIGEMIVKWLG